MYFFNEMKNNLFEKKKLEYVDVYLIKYFVIELFKV